ncbi:MAG: Rpn family recombination-promoting nuclease/putative transposase [Saprospiraceae bacterium]
MANTNPHDALFKATMSHPSEVEALVRGFLPAIISENLDFTTLQMENTAYISADLRDYFSDISYSCLWKGDADKPPVQITLLLEHKSYLPDNIHLQLLRYITECYQYQYRNGDKLLHLVLPIVVYHGDEEWKVRDFADHFDLPHPDLKRYIPFFSYELLDLSHVSNETLFQLNTGSCYAALSYSTNSGETRQCSCICWENL